jgi:hypothetical protein
VVLLIGAQRISFTEDLKGPLSIGWDEQHNVVYRFGQGVARPITEVARVSQAAPPDRHAHNAAA